MPHSHDELDDTHLTERQRELLEKGRNAELVDAIRLVVRQEVNETLAKYYGDREPEKVLEIIRSAEKFHQRLDNLTDSFWGAAWAWIVKIGFWIFLIVAVSQAAGFLRFAKVEPPFVP